MRYSLLPVFLAFQRSPKGIGDSVVDDGAQHMKSCTSLSRQARRPQYVGFATAAKPAISALSRLAASALSSSYISRSAWNNAPTTVSQVRLHGRPSHEYLNEPLFSSLAQARAAITAWKDDYKTNRPGSSLANITPGEFAIKMAMEKQAA